MNIPDIVEANINDKDVICVLPIIVDDEFILYTGGKDGVMCKYSDIIRSKTKPYLLSANNFKTFKHKETNEKIIKILSSKSLGIVSCSYDGLIYSGRKLMIKSKRKHVIDFLILEKQNDKYIGFLTSDGNFYFYKYDNTSLKSIIKSFKPESNNDLEILGIRIHSSNPIPKNINIIYDSEMKENILISGIGFFYIISIDDIIKGNTSNGIYNDIGFSKSIVLHNPPGRIYLTDGNSIFTYNMKIRKNLEIFKCHKTLGEIIHGISFNEFFVFATSTGNICILNTVKKELVNKFFIKKEILSIDQTRKKIIVCTK